MPILDQLQKDLVAAMKAKDELRLGTIRMIKTAVQKAAAVDASKPLNDAAEQQILKSLAKQRVESAEMFRTGGREELALKEEAERVIIEAYLPAAASELEIDDAIEAAVQELAAAVPVPVGIKQMGQIMKAAQAKLAGKTVDGKVMSEKVKARLS
ncbi:MAG: uncharacterized protein QOJ99_3316 [Bryobacterales bacterium]|jgi:uncharacterized protein YqeY|nr:uncharacterized protein [Bryobacterales bacterium]